MKKIGYEGVFLSICRLVFLNAFKTIRQSEQIKLNLNNSETNERRNQVHKSTMVWVLQYEQIFVRNVQFTRVTRLHIKPNECGWFTINNVIYRSSL